MQINVSQARYETYAWFDAIDGVPNNKIDAATKTVIRGLARIILSSLDDTPTASFPHCLTRFTKVWYGRLEEETGLSPSSVIKCVAKLEDMRAIYKQAEYSKAKDGNTKRHIYLCFDLLFLTNITRFLSEVQESNHGGKRVSVRCPSCGEYHPLHLSRRVICTGCGAEIEEMRQEIIIENTPPTEEEILGQKEELKQLDEKVAAIETYGADVANIPDEAIEELGGVEEALNASPVVIAEVIKNREDILTLASSHTKGMYHINGSNSDTKPGNKTNSRHYPRPRRKT